MTKNILVVFTIYTKALYNFISPLIRFVLSTNAVVSICCSSLYVTFMWKHISCYIWKWKGTL